MTSRLQHTYTGLPITIRTYDHKEKPSERVSSKYIVLLLAFYISIAFIIQFVEDCMPRVVKERDVQLDDSDTFSEEKAKRYLHRILGDQPRVSGTVYHFVKTREMKYILDEIASTSNLPIHTDWQYVAGDYWLAFNPPYVNCYQNLSNVIAVLEGQSGFHPNGTIGKSLLVNCHYDSVPFAIGASDNGVFCAVMAETLYKLSRRKQKLKYNVIFLFNGAEENVLMGSHGFLSHPWSKGVTNVVNLDSAGMNGRPSVFQVTDPRTLEIYKRTSQKPSAQGLGEVLFASGIIPSDTDFRIFRDFRDIHGIDIAFTKGGNVYHTRNDKPENIKDGVVQNAGNMLLNLVRDVADSDVLENKQNKSTVVYYDYVGLFLVTYSSEAALWIDLSVGLFALSTVLYYLWLFGLRASSILELLWSAAGRVLCVCGGFVTVAVFTFIMTATTSQLRYLSRQWMVLPLYWIPFFIVMIYFSHEFDSWRAKKRSLNRSIRVVQAMSATRLLLAVTLLLQCCFPSLSNIRYVITVPLALMSVASVFSLTFVRYGRLKGWQHLGLEACLGLPAIGFCLSLSLRLLPLLLPIMGRSAVNKPDHVVMIICAVLATVAAWTVSGMELLFCDRKLRVVLCAALCACAAAMVWPAAPYRADTTQRHYWFHTQITTHNANSTATETVSGVLVTRLDVNSVTSALSAIKEGPFYVESENFESNRSFVIRERDLELITADNCDSVYCNLPLFRLRFEKFMKNSLFITMGPPKHFVHSLKLVNRTRENNSYVLNFIMNGPAHNTITIWPRHNVTLARWSFESAVKETQRHKDRPLYVIIHSTATYTEFFQPLEFSLTFNVTNPQSEIVDISHHAHKIHHPEDFTRDYVELVDSMPDYFNIASHLSFRDNYVF